MSKIRRFGLYTCLRAIQRKNGRVILTRRIVSGMQEHAAHWDGEVELVCEVVDEQTGASDQDRALSGDNAEFDPKELPFTLHLVDFESPQTRALLEGHTVALCGLGHRTTHLASWGVRLKTPVIYTTEYTLKTRLQIVRAEELRPLKQAKRIAWETNLERKRLGALFYAAGVQCNGAPTYDQYRHINRVPMLFFDNRLSEADLITQAQIEARARAQGPLRLVFFGRLNKMKGVEHLPRIALALKEKRVPFSLKIFGGGVLEPQLRAQVDKLGLGQQVQIEGFRALKEELLPHFKQSVDLFLCSHIQGDPAMAYLESLGAGVPIMGFANEALHGLLARAEVGQDAPIGDAQALAEHIAALARSGGRERLRAWSENAVAFARAHLFDKSFERRMRHVAAITELFA